MELTSTLVFLLFAGVLLPDRGQACDVIKLTECLNLTMTSSIVKTLSCSSPPSTLCAAARKSLTLSDYKTACTMLKMADGCIMDQTKGCSAVDISQLMQESQLSFYDLHNYVCKYDSYCEMQRGGCIGDQDWIHDLTASLAINELKCRLANDVHLCLTSMPQCNVDSNFKQYTEATELYIDRCKEAECNPLAHCQFNYNQTAEPNTNGIDGKTCRIYMDLTACVTTAWEAECPPDGKPAPPYLPALVEEACDLMEASDVAALYSCNAYTACINVYLKVNPTSPHNMCRALQIALLCSGSMSAGCPGVTGSADFNLKVNNLALKAASMGCGVPGINADSCEALTTCKRARQTRSQELTQLLGAGDPNSTQCSGLSAFQHCAHEAALTCNLHLWGSKPTLGELADINEAICDVMAGQPLLSYDRCLGTIVEPKADGELLSASAWCGVSTQVVLCGILVSQYPLYNVTTAFEDSLADAYKMLTELGCADPLTQHPIFAAISGAASLTPLFCAIFLSLAAIFLRHQ